MAKERGQWGAAQRAYRNPERKAQEAVYSELHRYAGELLTIETFTVPNHGLSMRTIDVRYDEDTTFGINLYRADLEKLTDAGYDLPQTKGSSPFHAEITCIWQKLPFGEYKLVIDTVSPKAKEKTMETVQPVTAAPDTAAIIAELSRLRDVLANSPTILGLSGDALTVATAKANAAHYIDNAIGSLTRALPVPVISADDVTEEIPSLDNIEDAA